MQVEINKVQYRTGKMDAIKQFHVTRRLAPAIWSVSAALAVLRANGGNFSDESAISAMEPVAQMMSKMSDEDSEYVIKACLAVCQKQQGDGWASVLAANGGLMFQDMDMHTLLRITTETIKENLGSFFQNLPIPN